MSIANVNLIPAFLVVFWHDEPTLLRRIGWKNSAHMKMGLKSLFVVSYRMILFVVGILMGPQGGFHCSCCILA